MTALRIGTRGSRLARWQADRVGSLLSVTSEIVIVQTSGDVHKDVPLQGQPTMGFFTREIERELIEGRVDLAVHSLKDLPVVQPAGLSLGAILERHDPGDVLLVRPEAIADGPLPVREGARVGAGSMRRRSSLLAIRPDLVPVLVRGNVPTRVSKAAAGEVDAVILARAGIARLGIDPAPLLAFDLDPSAWVPAPGQAAIAVEIREADEAARAAVAPLDHAATRTCVEMERRLLAASGGGCHAPFAAWARPSAPGGSPAMGTILSMSAPGRNGAWRTVRFDGMPGEIAAMGRDWLSSGCPEDFAPAGQEEALCRPARPWS